MFYQYIVCGIIGSLAYYWSMHAVRAVFTTYRFIYYQSFIVIPSHCTDARLGCFAKCFYQIKMNSLFFGPFRKSIYSQVRH